jgi:lipopolysaccharide transport system ATP-binding protein
MTGIAIKIENLSKCYHIYDKPRDRLLQMLTRGRKQYFREFWALKDVSFEIKKGETVGIIGRNGSGKSTLLQLICGTLNSTHGNIYTYGRIAALLELGSGFNPHFTGRENVYLNGAVLGLSKEDINERFRDIARFADIGDFIEQPVMTYSSGMMVRLAFAVQIMVNPDILIVDEALAVGDEKFQRKCFARLEELKSQGTSILFVSHSGPQIVELCDKALLLEQGTRLMFAEPQSVVRAYQKLIYAPNDEQQRLKAEYISKDQLGLESEALALVEERRTAPMDEGSDFDPGLNPDTTTVYPVQGAEIHQFQILDSHGRVVNVLIPGQKYRFVITGQFLNYAEKIYFGIHIRSISGIVITGQRYPEEGNCIESIREGDKFRIDFGFTMMLLPGTYFVGGGVWSNHEPNCLHRILDALMFRVSPPNKTISFGYMDASSDEPVIELY